MMSTSYQVIADNIHTEHLYSQTRLWMEYIGEDKTRPVPLNLIPRLQTLIDLCTKPDKNAKKLLREEEESAYKKVCNALVKRYLRQELGRSEDEDPLEAPENICLENDPLLKKIDDWCNNPNSTKENTKEDETEMIHVATASV